MSETPVYDRLNGEDDTPEDVVLIKRARIYGKTTAHNAIVASGKTAAHSNAVSASGYLDSGPFAAITVPDNSDAPAWFTIGRRKWAYNVALALLVILTSWQGINAVTLDSWNALVLAVLNLPLIGSTALARKNVR